MKWKANWEEGARKALQQLADVLRLLRALMSGHKWLLADSASIANADALSSEEPSCSDVAEALDAFVLAAADARANCRPLSNRTLLDSLKSIDTRSAPERGKIKTLVDAHNRCMHILERIGPVFWRNQDQEPDETVAFHNGVKNAAGSLYSQALFGGPDASWKKLLGMFHSLTSAMWEAVERDEAIERQRVESAGRTPDKASEMRSEAPHAALTDTEENILEALGDGHIKGKPLLARAGYDYSSHGREVLSNLVKRGILNNDKTGYFRVET